MTRVVRGVRLASTAMLLAEGGAGAFTIEANGYRAPLLRLLYSCPCGCGSYGSAILGPGPETFPKVYAWSGDRDRPTLSGAIELGDHYRGQLIGGEWHPC